MAASSPARRSTSTAVPRITDLSRGRPRRQNKGNGHSKRQKTGG
jgi:hypothetical protein